MTTTNTERKPWVTTKLFEGCYTVSMRYSPVGVYRIVLTDSGFSSDESARPARFSSVREANAAAKKALSK